MDYKSINKSKENTMSTKESLEIAARCWCDAETEHIVMNVPLAEAFAKRLDKNQELIGELQDYILWLREVNYGYLDYEYHLSTKGIICKRYTYRE